MPRPSDTPFPQSAVPEAQYRRRIALMPTGWLSATNLVERRVVGSNTSLDRLLARAANDNPFPKPARDAATRMRFWREGDVTLWVELERQHRERRLLQPEPRRDHRQGSLLEAKGVVS